MTPQAPAATPHPGHGLNGRFTPGNPGGPGNPYARQVAALRQRLLAKLTPEDLDAIAEKLIDQAKQGDVAAARLLFQHALGKPPECAHPDRIDQDEMAAFRAQVTKDEMFDALEWTPMQPFLVVLRELLPARRKAAVNQLREGLAASAARDKAKAEATVTKRSNERPQVTPGDGAASNVTETEALNLINLAQAKRRRDDRQAANSGQH